MRRILVACCLLLLVPASADASTARAGSARAIAGEGIATLKNGRIARSWSTSGGAVVTTSLSSGGKNGEWSNGNSPDFTLDLNGVPTSSTEGWTLKSVTARREPADAARPDRKRGVQLDFVYT